MSTKYLLTSLVALMPELAGQAFIRLGRDSNFRLPIERLSNLTPTIAEETPPAEEDRG